MESFGLGNSFGPSALKLSIGNLCLGSFVCELLPGGFRVIVSAWGYYFGNLRFVLTLSWNFHFGSCDRKFCLGDEAI